MVANEIKSLKETILLVHATCTVALALVLGGFIFEGNMIHRQLLFCHVVINFKRQCSFKVIQKITGWLYYIL